MIVYVCGFNGFRQITDLCCDNVPFLSLPIENISEIDFSWRCAIAIAGSNIYQSGCEKNDSSCWKKLPKPNESIKFLKVACHESYALLVTDNGECWQLFYYSKSWKKLINFSTVEEAISFSPNSKYSELAAGNPGNSSSLIDDSQRKIIKICCGEILNVALDNQGLAYRIPSPITLPGIIIKDISCGFEHCLMLDELGRVFSWGSGMRGQLGREVLETTEVPQEVDALGGLHVICIAAGGWHSAAVTSSGILYTWGWNNSGQLGFPSLKPMDSKCMYHPKEEEEREDCNGKPKSGEVFYNNEVIADDTQCNVSTYTEHHNIGEKKDANSSIKNLKKIKLNTATQITEATCEDSSGKSCGLKEYVAVLAVPQPVSFPCQSEVDVLDVSCGNRHTVSLTSDGSLWGCGWNAYGQLGVSPDVMISSDSFTKMDLPTGKMKIIRIHCAGWNTAVFIDGKS